MTQDIRVETVQARITIEDNMSKSTEQIPLKWVLPAQAYEKLLEVIQLGYADLIEEVDMLDKHSDGFEETADG